MNRLLKRQLRKHLSEEAFNDEKLKPFLAAVESSYNNFDEQFFMLQRAMTISSEELFDANNLLRKESESQKEIINKLKSVIDRLKYYGLETSEDEMEVDSSKLIDFIENQTKEIIAINKQREKLLKSLSEQNQELSDYAHMASHDLKSPLRSLNALATWLEEEYAEKLDEGGQNYIALIKNNVLKMDKLITGILEYSTIGKTEKEIFDVDLNIMMNEMLETLHIPKNIEIQIEGRLPKVKGNKYRLHQLFQNFIVNAIKYNDKEKGEILIGCNFKNENYWEFYVKDNGIGIEKKYFKQIFKTFQKLENHDDSSGIGLSIVKKIIELYEGKIWITSTPKKGSTFYFTIKKHYGKT